MWAHEGRYGGLLAEMYGPIRGDMVAHLIRRRCGCSSGEILGASLAEMFGLI
jgi:hypothetical protein